MHASHAQWGASTAFEVQAAGCPISFQEIPGNGIPQLTALGVTAGKAGGTAIHNDHRFGIALATKAR